MAVPNKLRVFTVYIDGENKLGRVTSFTSPKLTRKNGVLPWCRDARQCFRRLWS
ncbi:major tail sheath protein FII from prophage [Escherichia coli]|uniref:Major tail sheath protein FII from prophage n=1 Tax=Escherichia coli TaxID=562 RepID=A0A376W0Q6_ECOLX|nr:major tail sheath protein FII from prophage [Escherichia coli]